MREYVATAKTVEEAIQLGCDALSVDRDDLGVSYEILEMPQKTGFLGLKVTPAKVKVTVETADTEPETTPAAPVAAAEPEPAPAEEAAEQPAAEDAAPAEAETPLDIAADPRLQAAVDYLTPIFHLMGVEEFTFTAGKKGEATILHVEGAHLGALIGRRGETMESLSYLASLVVNRMEGPYVKLGIDVGGYRNKREDDLTALAVRIANRVIRTGCYYEMEPMNPYERHIIHTAVAEIEGVRSESKGEGPDRRVVIYSTDPNASNLPDRDAPRGRRSGPNRGNRNGRSFNGNRGPRNDNRRGGGYRGNSSRPPRDNRGGSRNGGRGYGRPSSVPEREFASAPRDPNARPQALARTARIHDGDDFDMFGKIEL